MKAIKEVRPDVLVILGDFLDCYCISFHDKNPERAKFLDDEIVGAKAALRELEALPFVKRFIYLEGNHEERMNRYLIRKAPELYRIVAIPKLLELPKKWEYLPYRKFAKIGKLHITHDVGRIGKYAAHSTLADFQDNVAFGHTHRLGIVYGGNTLGTSHVSAMFGWGGSLEHIDYMFDAVSRREWMLGFGIGYLEQNGDVHLQAIPVINRKCCINGKILQ